MMLEVPTFEEFLKELQQDKIETVRRMVSYNNRDNYSIDASIIYTCVVGSSGYRFVEIMSNDKPLSTDEEVKKFFDSVSERQSAHQKQFDDLKIAVKEGMWTNG